jgi:hypothetical protein
MTDDMLAPSGPAIRNRDGQIVLPNDTNPGSSARRTPHALGHLAGPWGAHRHTGIRDASVDPIDFLDPVRVEISYSTVLVSRIF